MVSELSSARVIFVALVAVPLKEPTNEVAVTTPTTIIPVELAVTADPTVTEVAVIIPLEIILPTSKEPAPRSKDPRLAVRIPLIVALLVTVRSATEIECPVKTPTLNGEASIHCFDVPYPTSLSS